MPQANSLRCAKSIQSHPTLCDPMDCSLPGSSVHVILQERILEWVACPSPGDLSDPGIKSMSLMSSALASGFCTTRATARSNSLALSKHELTQSSFFFNVFIWDYTESLLLHTGFLKWRKVGVTLYLQRPGFSLRRLLLLWSLGSRVLRLQES